MEVGHLRKGPLPFRVKKRKKREDHSEVLREGADDLTLRAEEVDTIKACINVDHIGENLGDRPWWTQTGTPFFQAIFGVGIVEPCVNVGHIAEDRWRPPLLDADWHAFCQAFYRGIEGSEWEEEEEERRIV